MLLHYITRAPLHIDLRHRVFTYHCTTACSAPPSLLNGAISSASRCCDAGRMLRGFSTSHEAIAGPPAQHPMMPGNLLWSSNRMFLSRPRSRPYLGIYPKQLQVDTYYLHSRATSHWLNCWLPTQKQRYQLPWSCIIEVHIHLVNMNCNIWEAIVYPCQPDSPHTFITPVVHVASYRPACWSVVTPAIASPPQSPRRLAP